MRCSLLLLLFIAAQINETLLGVPELSARKKHRTEELEDEVKENAAEEDVDGGEVEYEYEYEYEEEEEDENEDFDDDDEDDGDDDGDDEYYYYYYYYYDDEENVTSSELPSTSVGGEISTTPYYEYYEELPSDYDNNKKSTLKTPDIEEFLQEIVSANPNEGVDVNEFFSETNSSSVITESSEPELEQILTEQPIISLAATKITSSAAAEIKLTSPSYKTSSQSVVPRLTTSTSRKPLAAHILTEIKPNSTPAGSKPILNTSLASTPKTITSAANIQSVKPKTTAITTTKTEKVTQANKATTQLKAQVANSVSTTRLISTSLAATVKTSTLSTKSSSTTKKIPATTSSTTTTSTSAPMDPAMFRKNCHAKQFSKLLKCCEPAAKNLVPLASRDRSCKANPSLLNAFNSYSLNKLQYSKNLRTKNFKFRNSKIQKAMGKSACFVNCFLISNGAMTEDLLIKEEQLITFLTSMQTDQKWVSFISSAVSECLTLTSGFQVPSFSRASKKCDGTAYVATQCVLHKMIADCPNRVMTKQCYESYLLFDKCSTPTLAFAFQLHDRKKRLKFSNKNKNG